MLLAKLKIDGQEPGKEGRQKGRQKYEESIHATYKDRKEWEEGRKKTIFCFPFSLSPPYYAF